MSAARRTGLAVLGALLMAGSGLADGYVAPPHGGFAPVTVDLKNESPRAMRCVVLLAHFVTRTPDPVASGGEVSLMFERQPGSGVLAYGSHAGSPMLVENLLCGADHDWDGTRADIPLTTIRSGNASAYVVTCRLEGRVVCSVEPE
ncbi:MAG: hypothetical protein ACFCVH_20145 [Alphaproteobacteria bacterium]